MTKKDLNHMLLRLFMVDLFAALFLGVLLGSFTGLIPGLHSNLLASLLIALPFTWTISTGVFLISLATTHLFVTIIPSIYLSLPNETNVVSLLPGQRLVKEGKGYEGVLIHAQSTLLTLLVIVPILFFVAPVLPSLYAFLGPVLPFLLMLALISFLEQSQLLWRVIILLFAGTLGLVVLYYNNAISQPLLPLLSGLFGLPALLFSSSAKIPLQRVRAVVLDKQHRSRLPLGWITGALVGFLPGVGTAHAASIAQLGKKKCAPHSLLALLAALACSNFLFSLATSTSIGRARNGVVALLMEKNIQLSLPLYAATVFASGGLGYIIVCYFALVFAQHAQVLAHPFLRPLLLFFIVGLVLMVSGWMGLLVLITATAIGVLPLFVSLERSILMASLITPVLVALWPF